MQSTNTDRMDYSLLVRGDTPATWTLVAVLSTFAWAEQELARLQRDNPTSEFRILPREELTAARQSAIDALLALARIEADLDIRECARMSAGDLKYFIQQIGLTAMPSLEISR